MLKVQRRHRLPCKRPMWDQGYTKCKCPILIVGTLNKKRVMLSTAKFLPPIKARDMDTASALARLWESAGKPVPPEELPTLATADDSPRKKKATIETATKAYIQNAIDIGNEPSTISAKRSLFTTGPASLNRYALKHGLRFLDELDAEQLRAWRGTWDIGPVTRREHQRSAMNFVWFAESSGWLSPGTARFMKDAMGKIKVTRVATGYFEPDEYRRLIDTTYLMEFRRWLPGGQPLRALIELMRWTGLRIRDALTLERSRLIEDPETRLWSVGIYQKKTDGWVYCPVPPFVADLLHKTSANWTEGWGGPSRDYFFWDGNGKPQTAVSNWEKKFRRLFLLAAFETKRDSTTRHWKDGFALHRLTKTGKLKHCHPHMFRDTFAVQALVSGMPLEDVSTLLGHGSTKVTQEHYMPWVKARQTMLNQRATNSWEKQGVGNPPQPNRGKVIRMTRAS